jgi:hypothetical protein
MPADPVLRTYTFDLLTGDDRVADEAGVLLPDREHAHDYALQVVRDLMRSREPKTRSWRLDIYEDGHRIGEIPFAKGRPHTRSFVPAGAGSGRAAVPSPPVDPRGGPGCAYCQAGGHGAGGALPGQAILGDRAR